MARISTIGGECCQGNMVGVNYFNMCLFSVRNVTDIKYLTLYITFNIYIYIYIYI